LKGEGGNAEQALNVDSTLFLPYSLLFIRLSDSQKGKMTGPVYFIVNLAIKHPNIFLVFADQSLVIIKQNRE
jgi:hypothetical protein